MFCFGIGEVMFECFGIGEVMFECFVLVLVKWMYEHTVWLLSNTMFDSLVWYG